MQLILPFVCIGVDWNDNSQLCGDPLQEGQDMQAKYKACTYPVLYHIWTSIPPANTNVASFEKAQAPSPWPHMQKEEVEQMFDSAQELLQVLMWGMDGNQTSCPFKH